MKRLLFAIVFLLFLFSSFGFVSWSIIRIKLKELKYFVAKDQLLNLKLSSEVLRDKFKQLLLYREDYKKELELSVQDSNSMNSTSFLDISLDRWDYSGLAIVNGVRRTSWKRPLTFLQDKELLAKLQYAFYLERVHRYPKAVKEYQKLEPAFQKNQNEEFGFVLLHQGFCLGLLEQTEEALAKLHEVEERFPGTHYATSARVLIVLLLEGKRKKQDIMTQAYTQTEKIVKLYSNGFYKAALQELEKLDAADLTRPLQYIRGRSLEETGQSPKADLAYLDLTVGEDVVAQQANRRLAFSSIVYNKNKDLEEYVKRKARELGDTAMIQQVETKAKQIQKTKVLANAEEYKNHEEKEILNSLRENLEKVKQQQYVLDLQSYKMKIVLADRRNIVGKTLQYANNTVRIQAKELSIHVQDYMISEISVFRENNKRGKRKQPFMTVTMKDGTKKKAFKIRVIGDSFIIATSKETAYKPNQVKSIVAGQ
ncbi:MAG: hypothetical protein AAF518_03240 [Spirochaetota bacterium]